MLIETKKSLFLGFISFNNFLTTYDLCSIQTDKAIHFFTILPY